jgi:hypothetical protein
MNVRCARCGWKEDAPLSLIEKWSWRCPKCGHFLERGPSLRYLIGDSQPEYRLQAGNPRGAVSQFVRYTSIRTVLGKAHEGTTIDRNEFKHRFQNSLDGFMAIVFASVFLLENDLSSENMALWAILAHCSRSITDSRCRACD